MNQTILFTPVGGTDPISSTNIHDGSMLHICRVYQPQKVILYMSKEMLDNQEKDNRYRYCLDRLAQMQNRKVEYEVIERRELTKVHEFDYFYQDFRDIISRVFVQTSEFPRGKQRNVFRRAGLQGERGGRRPGLTVHAVPAMTLFLV